MPPRCLRLVRYLWRWRGQNIGVALVRAIPAIAVAMLVLRIIAAAAHAQIEPAWPRGNLDRVAISRELDNMPGRSLVLVSYSPAHNVDWEWVYNAADIDGAKVVWARDMGARDNAELLQYFHDRQVWRLNADQSPPKLEQ